MICEKPLAGSVHDAQAIARAAAEAKTFFMPAMCMRFWPEWAWLKEVISDNRYGRVLGASFLRQGTAPPGWYRNGEMSGGAILDLHIHDTDFVCHLFGKPKAVSSRGYRAQSGQIDHVSTQYLYDDVPLVVADGGWSFSEPYPFRMRYTVNFENKLRRISIWRDRSRCWFTRAAALAQFNVRLSMDGSGRSATSLSACPSESHRPSSPSMTLSVR